jgi:hypothetical protein
MPTNKRAIVVGTAACAFAIFVVAVVLAISGDPYLGMFALGCMALSAFIALTALLIHVVGMPKSRGVLLFLTGALAIALVLVGSLVATDWYVRKSREARNATVDHGHRVQAQVQIYLLTRNS